MEASNRFAAEAELQKALAVVWSEWSKDRDPAKLTKEYLEELLQNECEGPLWAVWLAANTNVLMEYGQQQDEAALTVVFLAFFSGWKRDMAERWGARVESHIEETTSFGGGGGGGGGGSGSSGGTGPTTHFDTIGKPISFQEAAANHNAEKVDKPEEPLPWSKAKKEMLIEHDFVREAVTAVTTTHTQGELNAAVKVHSAGQMLIAIWRAEHGACKVCASLNGKRPNEWKKVAPNGPGKEPHPGCQCHLEWVAIEDT